MEKLPQSTVEDWVKEATGWFTARDICEELDIESASNKAYLRTVLKRLRDNKVIGYVDGHHGKYRLLDTDLEKMQLSRANPKNVIPIKFPFGLEEYVKIFRKNVIIIAGSKDAGKTAFFINVMRLNMGKLPIRYLNTDMGEEELRMRVEKFDDVTIEQWDKYIEMYEKPYILPEHIDPNAINLVDFLEVHDEFYKAGKPIKDMSAMLNDGILMVAIQKNPGAEEGLGGHRTLEKAKLALNLEPGKIWIRVAKNWQDGVTSSPKGKKWTYKLVGGALIISPHEVIE